MITYSQGNERLVQYLCDISINTIFARQKRYDVPYTHGILTCNHMLECAGCWSGLPVGQARGMCEEHIHGTWPLSQHHCLFLYALQLPRFRKQ
jgi:hypothetical protein